MSMNPEAETKLAEILAKDVSEITEDDAAFLRARASYLDDDQKDQFAQFLNPAYMPANEPGEGEVDLNELKRPELEKIATELGIEQANQPKVFPNKGKLIEAILAKQAELEASATESTESGDESKVDESQE